MRPQIVAHRGASDELAEHTLGAYQRALELGVDALECDVRLTSDGHLVCVHDRNVRRTTNGVGVVSSMELTELAELDFAAWRRSPPDGPAETPDFDAERDGVLTLRRLFEIVAAQERRVEVAVETKHPTRYAGEVERALVGLLEEFGWNTADSPVRVMSFSYVALRRVRRLAPTMRPVMLFEHARRWPALRPLVGHDWIAGPGIDTLRKNPGFARRLVESGREVHVWTANTEAEVQTCLDLGVGAIITDRPSFVIDRVGSMSGPTGPRPC
ncbi:glycerophosphodiester phosphodiesterase [Nocardioides agariphilus]|jgi:glycerophosphoryl diester phosphodiesterase|uniref:Glycerophosphodiester phosphodiesterase n=1 Tax=Nocardioides agariphilus TaxID=433664 RepID=A0A930YN10_9ACTN|nr:glycerophosphodiester phosphodiesterase family protein [Nocardioides agariphilus]MBF4766155.1 glycerophosphodiester phosphodiesterase [Nocardioides agariphilus]